DPRYQALAPVPGPPDGALGPGGVPLGGGSSLAGCLVSGSEIPGVGWVDAATVAALFATLPVQVGRALLDADTGTLVSLTTGAYVSPKAMRRFVHTRDGTCRMWGCTRRATHTDVDHTKPWPSGPTSPSNLVSLCRRHHRMKQYGRWRYTLEPNGDVTWVSTTGTVRRTHPAHRVIPPPGSRRTPTSGAMRELEPASAATVPAVESRPAPDPPPF
ncbi:MAG: HNH endonuclease signature motif containing protein, partial [Dermatophilaceae bacterium]